MAKRVTKTPAKAIKGNALKYESYREAFARIGLSIEKNFYFEAITLAESIISDRLLSYAKGKQILSFKDGKEKVKKNGWTVRTEFNELIVSVKHHLEAHTKRKKDIYLLTRVDNWRKNRNRDIHNFAKSEPGMSTIPVDKALEQAKRTAESGRKLCRSVVKWHTRERVATGVSTDT